MGFVFLPRPPLPPILSLFGSDLEMSHDPLAIQWPPMSVGTLLTDSLAQGWAQERAGLSTSQSSPVPLLPVPPSSPFLASRLPLWPLRSCHLGYAIPFEVGDRGPHLQGLIPPKHPCFYSKGTDCHLGAGTWPPKGSVLTEPQATDGGPEQGNQVARGQGTFTPSCICNA